MAEGLDHAAQALLLGQAPTGVKNTDAAVLVNVGQAYYKLGEFEKALAYSNEALRTWQTLGEKRAEAVTLKHIASALRDLSRLAEAQVNIEKSIALLEYLRDHAGSPELRSSFTASLFNFYEFYIDLMMRLHVVRRRGTIWRRWLSPKNSKPEAS